ncbi:S-adenosyl-L-methionine-dependent methyltransferase [Zychaea mexicana]|uniref:S-adenosyl-L-methionine-dependent methyltransferase n=1 Tax=Zychaea mexicana TaxID=64656 RepID=UPI0022FE2F86|nr:S-adenosyl-L-methionine-dependent methyltransferase [Zychaea mexicana]KAI9498907.1 S-adenosyl-L-methionine-dependent methyltransferase [Zychaea mexicana]
MWFCPGNEHSYQEDNAPSCGPLLRRSLRPPRFVGVTLANIAKMSTAFIYMTTTNNHQLDFFVFCANIFLSYHIMSLIPTNEHKEQIQHMRRLHGDLVLDEGGFFKKLMQKDQTLNKEAATAYNSNWNDNSNNNNKYDDDIKQQQHEDNGEDSVSHRREQAQSMTNAFYDLVTDFYEYGWGQSFHFARLYKGDTFAENIKRHEAFLALKLGLKQGQRVLDVGCGVGGPLREIVKFSGYAHVTGINNNVYQIQRCAAYAAKYGLSDYTGFVKGDFTKMPFADCSFDAVFSVEATVHAPRLEMVYSEIYRVLQPGGRFACYEWCTTPKYNNDTSDDTMKNTRKQHQQQRQVIHAIEQGNSISKLYSTRECLEALKSVGFRVIEQADFAPVDAATVPWYYALKRPEGLRGILRSPVGRFYTHSLLTALSKCKLVPPGVLETSQLLNDAADALVAGGEMGIFTPMYFFVVEKPLEKKN